jgi:hypothetical protein
MGVTIWDFLEQWSHRPPREECNAPVEIAREERERSDDAEQDEDEKDASGGDGGREHLTSPERQEYRNWGYCAACGWALTAAIADDRLVLRWWLVQPSRAGGQGALRCQIRHAWASALGRSRCTCFTNQSLRPSSSVS